MAVLDEIALGRHRDLVGRRREQWIRRGLLLLLAAFLVAALANAFGQQPSTVTASAPAARLKLYAPAHLRGGLIFEARFTIGARAEIRKAILVLDPGWLEGMTLNTVEPAPLAEASRDGRLAFDLGHIPGGVDYTLFLQFQVNPTNVGRRSQDVDLYDGARHLVHVDHAVTVFP